MREWFGSESYEFASKMSPGRQLSERCRIPVQEAHSRGCSLFAEGPVLCHASLSIGLLTVVASFPGASESERRRDQAGRSKGTQCRRGIHRGPYTMRWGLLGVPTETQQEMISSIRGESLRI